MPDLSPEDALEVEADLRRRVTSAFRLGSEASPRASGPSAAGQLAAGIAIAVAIALVLGVIALAQGSSTSGGASRSPSPTVSPTR
jgi:cytolysin (calcineurin-like family phosphatase)